MTMVLYDQAKKDGVDDYFRLNISGMSFMLDQMESVNAVNLEARHERFPDFIDADDESLEMIAYNTKLNRVLSAVDDLENGVPAYKFYSNDGWIVTPDECLFLADKLMNRYTQLQYGVDEDLLTAPLVLRFVNYCRAAAKYGGFRVY